MGDLNCNTFNNSLDNHTSRLIDILDNYQFFQIIDEPTRVTQTTKSLIDHFITKSRENVILSGVYPLSISDHSLIFAVRKIGTPRGNPRFIESRSFKNFDQNRFKLDLQNANWPPIGSVNNANDYWSKWKSIFLEIVDKHAPCRTKKVRSRPSPWITSEIKKQMYSRDKLKKKAMKTNKPEIWDDYKKIKNNVNKAVKRTKKSFYRQEIQSKAGDCKGTWKVLNNLMDRKSKNTQIKEIKLTPTESETKPEGIADQLNKHFTEIGSKLASEIMEPPSGVSFKNYLTKTDTKFKLKKVKPAKVLKLLSTVDPGKASGVDQISNKLLKIAAPYIHLSLTDFFNLSVETNTFPWELEIAKVYPLFKDGELNDKNNYRPISVIPTVARVFERLIYDQLYNYLNDNNLIDTQQSGFRSLHSTVTALLDLTNDWCVNIDKKCVNGAIFLDLKKAFDTVNHQILLKKLEYFGFDPTAITFFHSYLSNRKQQCNVNGVNSDLLHVSCGVPQGTILGPLLFLMYINDLPNCLKYCTARLYADDTSLTVSGSHIPDIENVMNIDLGHVTLWLIANKLSLNILKSECMIIGSRQRIATLEGDLNLSVNGISLKRVKHTKCLGVHIDENLTWAKHVEYITKKVVCNISILRKVSSTLTPDNRNTVYKSIIEPYFNYCSPVWDSIGDTLSKKLQRLQNRAAGIVTGLSCHPKSVRSKQILNQLGWSSLAEMRKQQKAIMMYKIVHGLAPSYLTDMFTEQKGSKIYDLRESKLSLEIPPARTSQFRNCFAFTGALTSNALPDHIKEQSPVSAFKRKIKTFEFASTTQNQML